MHSRSHHGVRAVIGAINAVEQEYQKALMHQELVQTLLVFVLQEKHVLHMYIL